MRDNRRSRSRRDLLNNHLDVADLVAVIVDSPLNLS